MAAPHLALIDFTMHHPFGHCLSWAAYEADAIFHDSPKRLGSANALSCSVTGDVVPGCSGRILQSSYRAHNISQLFRAAPEGVEWCGQAPSVVRSRAIRAERADRLAYVTC